MTPPSTDPSESGAPASAEDSDQSAAATRPPGTSQDAPGPPPTDDPAAHEAVQDAPDPVEAPD